MARDPYAGMDPGFSSALRQLIADAPGKVTVTSGYRSHAEQAALYKRKPKLAAPPGKSRHERGMAADLAFESPAVQKWVHDNAYRYGLRFPMLTKAPGKKYEPWHVEPIGAAGRMPTRATAMAGGHEEGGHQGRRQELPNEYADDPHDIGTQTSIFLSILEDPLGDLFNEAPFTSPTPPPAPEQEAA